MLTRQHGSDRIVFVAPCCKGSCHSKGGSGGENVRVAGIGARGGETGDRRSGLHPDSSSTVSPARDAGAEPSPIRRHQRGQSTFLMTSLLFGSLMRSRHAHLDHMRIAQESLRCSGRGR